MSPEIWLWVCLVLLGALLFFLTVAAYVLSNSPTSPILVCRRHDQRAQAIRCAREKRTFLTTSPRSRLRDTTSPRSRLRDTTSQRSRLRDSAHLRGHITLSRDHFDKHLHTPCSRCGKVNAKRDCSYMCCATCCRGNSDSVCYVHGTGYAVAEKGVESAIQYRLFQCDISYTNLKICPPTLTNIGRQLISLNLSNNRLKCLPEDIDRLSGLQELFLQYNHLSRLPTGICQLRSLAELDVKNNQLTHLPDSLCNLRKLVVLNLTNNALRMLPSRIGELLNLQELSLHCNLLEHLPSSFCQLTNLQMLYAGDNKLMCLPDEFGRLTKLEELDLSGCDLLMLPESLSLCHSLVHLWLTGNKLVTLPFHIGDLQRLSELHIRNNHIKFLPPSIVRLHLYTFTAQHNCFIDESAALQSSKAGTGPPPLLELSARAVYQFKLVPSHDRIPSHLRRILKYPLFCSTCYGPIFSYHHYAKFTFVTVCVCYRLPIYHMYCSKKCLPYAHP